MIHGPLACVAAVIVCERDRVLFIRRRDNGLWALPTGHVEAGEALIDAVCREVLEETGLRIHCPRLTGLYSHPDRQVVTFPDGKRRHFVTACFIGRSSCGRLRLQASEVSEAAFLPADEFPSPGVEVHKSWLESALAGGAVVVD